jgi:hypothetical protein
MDTFVVGMRRAWCIRAMGHNVLVRRSDRAEAWSMVAAALILAVMTPFVCALGTSMYEDRSHAYSLEAQHRHLVTATVVDSGELVYGPGRVNSSARVKWNAAGHEHTGTIAWSGRASVGDQQRIWVDDQGRNAPPPRTSNRAAVDASVMAFTVWLGLFSAVAGAMYVIRWRLDVRRFAQWDAEMNQMSRGDRRNPQ